MWTITIIVLSILVCGLQSAAPLSCPKSCVCTGTELHCKSFDFIPKMEEREASTVTKLTINNATISAIPKLHVFTNLRTLNVASNKIKQLRSERFPKSLEFLDVSYNFITALPEDFDSAMKQLKELRLTGNPISCTCDSISLRNRLLNNKVVLSKPVKCHTPKDLYGKSWLTVSCVDDLFGEMLGDAPYEGSGFDNLITEAIDTAVPDKSLEDEFIRMDATTSLPLYVNKIDDHEEEGSGDIVNSSPVIETEDDPVEDVVDSKNQIPVTESPVISVNELPQQQIKSCNFNCSTPPPFENETDPIQSPDIISGVQVIVDNFDIHKTESPTSTISEISTVRLPPPHIDHTKNKDTEVLTDTVPVEDKAHLTEKSKESNTSTYIFLGAFLVLILLLVAFAIAKKRAGSGNRSPDDVVEKGDAKNGVELLKATNTPNGIRDDAPITNGHADNQIEPFEDVELRQKPNEAEGENSSLLVSEAKRVTIKAGELPDSTPKTPLLVTRLVNSDGSVVTTPTVHERV